MARRNSRTVPDDALAHPRSLFLSRAGVAAKPFGKKARGFVRIGTHALNAGAGTKLWTRLSKHKGLIAGGGNHKGSIFRLICWHGLMSRDGMQFPTLGGGKRRDGCGKGRRD